MQHPNINLLSMGSNCAEEEKREERREREGGREREKEGGRGGGKLPFYVRIIQFNKFVKMKSYTKAPFDDTQGKRENARKTQENILMKNKVVAIV
jgi:hypothetical protein